jgi:plasmid stability protein
MLYPEGEPQGQAMTLILELPDNKEAALKAKAQALGVSAEQYAEQVLTRELEEQSEPFWKAFTRQIQELPDAAFEHLPIDGASEHDHYLYGSPKRNS